MYSSPRSTSRSDPRCLSTPPTAASVCCSPVPHPLFSPPLAAAADPFQLSFFWDDGLSYAVSSSASSSPAQLSTAPLRVHVHSALSRTPTYTSSPPPLSCFPAPASAAWPDSSSDSSGDATTPSAATLTSDRCMPAPTSTLAASSVVFPHPLRLSRPPLPSPPPSPSHGGPAPPEPEPPQSVSGQLDSADCSLRLARQPLARQLLRKAKQRTVNANRRQREINAILRLAQLTPADSATAATTTTTATTAAGTTTTTAATTAMEAVAAAEQGTDKRESEWRKRSRSEVLEDSVRRIEQLECIVHSLTRPRHNDDAALSTSLCSPHLPQSALLFAGDISYPALLSTAVSSASLQSRCFVAGGPGVLLIIKSANNGALLDISRLCANVFGFDREQMIGRGLSEESTYNTIMGGSSGSSESSTRDTLQRDHTDADSDSDSDSDSDRDRVAGSQQLQRSSPSGVELLLSASAYSSGGGPHPDQYPSTLLRMRELYAGVASRIDVTWRVAVRDGRMFEVPCTCWCGPRDSSGRPSSVSFLSSLDQLVKIEPWDSKVVQGDRSE